MTIESAQVSVSTVAVSLASGGANGLRVRVNNTSGPTVYLGAATVAGTTGFSVAGTSALEWYLEAHEALYGITSSGTASVHVLRGGA